MATLDNAFESRERFGLTAGPALAVIERVWRAVREWRVVFAEAGVPDTQIALVAPAFREFAEICSPSLRQRL